MTSINEQLIAAGLVPLQSKDTQTPKTDPTSKLREDPKKIINGIVTLTPIVLSLLNSDESNFKRGLSVMLNNVRKTHQVLVNSAMENSYELTVSDYVLFNRLALEVNCQRLTSKVKISDQVLAQALNSAYEQDSLYAEFMEEELLEDEMSLQYIALAKLSKTIFVCMLKQSDAVDDEVVSEIMEYVIEEVDSNIRQTLIDHIAEAECHSVRSKLIEYSSEVLGTILDKEIAKDLMIEDRINYIKRSFKIAISLMIDVVEINFLKDKKQ
jgi:hypothetical protein